jgi:hypothetical protein
MVGPDWELARRIVREQKITGEIKSCSKDLMKQSGGLLGYSSSPYVCEAYAKYLSEKCGAKVDWHYMGGRPVFRAHPDVQGFYRGHANEFPLEQFHAFFMGVRGTVDGRPRKQDLDDSDHRGESPIAYTVNT